MRPASTRVLMVAALLGATWGLAQPLDYVVQPGDTCQSIATKVLGSPGQYRLIHELNALGPSPHKLVPGTRLKLSAASSPEALLTWLRPAVSVRPSRAPEWASAQQDNPLYRRDEVTTRREAAAVLTFRDETRLTLRENALIIIAGEDPARRASPRQASGVELVSGEARVSLSALRGVMPVTTPASRIAATGDDVQVSVDEQKMSRVSVHRGEAQVSAMGKKVQVTQGHGTRVALGKPPEPPRLLPPAPKWGATQTLFLIREVQVAVTLHFESAVKAEATRVELSADPKFATSQAEFEVVGGKAPVTLSTGRVFARLSARDESGLWSSPSETLELEVVSVPDFPNEAEKALTVAPLNMEGVTTWVDEVELTRPTPVNSAGRHTLSIARGSRRASLEFTVWRWYATAPSAVAPDGGLTEDGGTAVEAEGSTRTAEPVVVPFVRDVGPGAFSLSAPWLHRSAQSTVLDFRLEGRLPVSGPEVSLTAQVERDFTASLGGRASLTPQWSSSGGARLDLGGALTARLVRSGLFSAAVSVQGGAALTPVVGASRLRGQFLASAGLRGDTRGVFLSLGGEGVDVGGPAFVAGLQIHQRLGEQWLLSAEGHVRSDAFSSTRLEVRAAVRLSARFGAADWSVIGGLERRPDSPVTSVAAVQLTLP